MQERLIYDVGAHEGEDSEFYLKKGFAVVAIEANPALVDKIESRLRPFGGQATVVHAAVAERNGPAEFFVNVDSGWGTTRPEWAARYRRRRSPSQPVTVPGRRFQDILAEHGVPYYAKIDIEGSELLCLRALQDFAQRPKYVSIESGQQRWRDLLQEFRVLGELGYSKFKIVDQSTVAAQRPPYPAREGEYAEHTFAASGSGLFGEEIEQPWLAREAAIAAYRAIFVRYFVFDHFALLRRYRKRLGRFGSFAWYDTHAAL